ncbi:MAG: hypothetical protein ACOC4K_02525, partial [Verrucomicrobiota bacterium]
MQGRDQSNWLRGSPPPEDDAAFIAADHTFGNWPRIAAKWEDPLVQAREYRGICTARHSYVEDRAGPWLLYDNEADPCQLQNRARDPEWSALRAKLGERLRRFLSEYDDEFRPGMEYVREWGYEVDESGTLGWPDA